MKFPFAASLTIVALVMSTPGVAGKEVSSEEGGVYVFEPQFVLDMNRHQFSMLPGRISAVQDCSDIEFFCIASGAGSVRKFFSVTVPRKCSDPVLNQTWKTGAVTTRVIAVSQEMMGPGGKTKGDKSYFLADPEEKSVVYEYRPTGGIISVVVGRRDEDLIATFKKNGGRPAGLDGKVHQLVTFDRLAGCQGR